MIVVKPERPAQGTSRPSSAKIDPSSPGYNPGMAYLLELATLLTLRDKESVQRLGDILAGRLQGILRDARNLHPLIVSRVVNYIMNLLRLSYVWLPLPLHIGLIAEISRINPSCARLLSFIQSRVLTR